MTVLVTGGLGMLGASAVRELIGLGQSVVILAPRDHRERLLDIADRFVVEVGDVRDVNTVYDVLVRHKVDRICHVAAVLTTAGGRDPRLAYEVNVGSTVQLLTAATTLGVRRFVFVSSKAVYALPTGPYASPTSAPVPEDYDRKPNNLYGATKLAAELMIEHLGRAGGMSAAILRFGTTFGPGKGGSKYGPRADISAMIEAAHQRTPATFADTGERSDAVYVDDVGRGIALAVTADVPGVRAYNIATGVGILLTDVRDALQAVIPEATIDIRSAAPDVGGERRHVVLDVRKARADLGFEARFDLQAAVKAYLGSLAASPRERTSA